MNIKTKDDINSVPSPTSPPSLLSFFGELRTFVNIGSVPFSLIESAVSKKEANAALPIILFPGFASDDRYMKPLSQYLRNLGYQTEGWGLGVNLAGVNMPHTLGDISEAWDVEPFDGYDPANYNGEGGVPFLADKAKERVLQRSQELDSKVVLIGWSLGGYLAREAARDLPDNVAQIITLGAPVIGGPKYTKAASFFKAKGFDLDWIESESGKRDKTPIQQPITVIYSKSDAVVDWRAAVDKVSPNAQHVEVKASHLGMGFNRGIWRLIRLALSAHSSLRSSPEK